MPDHTTDDGRRYPPWVRIALWQGVFAMPLFGVIAIVGGAMRPGYSHINQAISELTEAGAADKVFLDPALLVTEIMGIAFGLGYFWMVRGMATPLKISALLLVLIGVIALFYHSNPMDPVGSEMTFEGMMHLVIVSVSAVAAITSVICAGIGWGRAAQTRWLARLSWILLGVMLFTGLISIPAGIWGWPAIGLWQRLNTSAFGLWQIATALYLLRLARPVADT